MYPKLSYMCATCAFEPNKNLVCSNCDRGDHYIAKSPEAREQAAIEHVKCTTMKRIFGIKKVVYNDPATIVLWADGTKTIVRVQNGETFDKEKGLAMAFAKKACGNTGSYFEEFKKWNHD